MTLESCACRRWQGRQPSFVPSFPDELFETLERHETPLDLHGAIPHSGRVRCRVCARVYRYDNSLYGCSFELEP